MTANLNAKDAFIKVLERTKPIGTSKEIWFKLGNTSFMTGEWNNTGDFPIRKSYLARKNDSKSRVCSIQTYNCWDFLSNWAKNNEGGISFFPAQPQSLPLKECIAVSDRVSTEIDDVSIELQRQRIEEFIKITSIVPAYTIYSGSKSLHIHFKLNRHEPIAKTTFLARLMCICLGGDPAIARPTQPMRMAGFWRKETGKEQTLEQYSDFQYSYQEFVDAFREYFVRKGIPWQEKISDERWREYKRQKRDNRLDLPKLFALLETELQEHRSLNKLADFDFEYSSSYIEPFPLEKALSKNNRLDLERGVTAQRYNTGLSIACDLVGCQSWLAQNNVGVAKQGQELFFEFCQRCRPGDGWNQKQWHSIWQQAMATPKTPAKQDLSQTLFWHRFNTDPEFKKHAVKRFRQKNSLVYARRKHYEWEQKQSNDNSNSEFITWLIAKANRLSRNFRKGFAPLTGKKAVVLPTEIRYQPHLPLPQKSDYQSKEPPQILFKPNQRIEVIDKLKKLGWHTILDRSFTGTGKSHDMGNLENLYGKVWYLDRHHRNPTVLSVEENMSDLRVRHNGMMQDTQRKTPGGRFYRHWAAPGEENPDFPSLCHKADLFIKYQQKGYQIDSLKEDGQSTNPICASCIYHKTKVANNMGEMVALCSDRIGENYGYRAARKQDLSKNKIRASLFSLPETDQYSYWDDIAIIDEASQTVPAIESVKVTLSDFSIKMLQISHNSILYKAIAPIGDLFYPYLAKKNKLPKYGLDSKEIADLLPPVPENIEEIIAAIAQLQPNHNDIVVESDKISYSQFERQNQQGSKDKQKLKAQIRSANREFIKDATQQTLKNIEALPANFILDLIEFWRDPSKKVLRILPSGELLISTKQERYSQILQEMGLVVLLDATGNKDILSLKLGITASEIIEIKREIPPLDNLLVTSINMPGMNSSDLSPSCLQKTETLAQKLAQVHPELVSLGIKKYAKTCQYDGWWFLDNRGSNAFKSCEALAAFGKPLINVGVAKDEYLILNGSLVGFEQYYQSLIDAEIIQLIGRPRAHLYRDKKFVVYLVGTNFDLSCLDRYGIKSISYQSYEIDPMAGTDKQISQTKLLEATIALIESKVTYKTLAQYTKLSPDYIKKLTGELGGIKEFRKWVLNLKNNNRCSTQKLDLEALLSHQKIIDWLKIDPAAAAVELVSIVRNHGWRDFVSYIECFSIEVQAKFWGLMRPLIFDEREIITIEHLAKKKQPPAKKVAL